MRNFVISLETAKSRREHISIEFNRQNVGFEFFNAITPDSSQKSINLLGLNFQKTELTEGEIACLLSHLTLWKKAVDEQFDFITIFEDDVYLGQESHLLLENYNWIPKDTHIIKLEVFSKKIKMGYQKQAIVPGKRALYQLNGIHLGCAGYILSRKACEQLLQYARSLDEMVAVDHIVFELFDQSTQYTPYQLSPGLCIQSDILKPTQKEIFESSLEQNRRKRFDIQVQHIKQKLTFKQKVVREWFRLIQQLMDVYQHRTIKFK